MRGAPDSGLNVESGKRKERSWQRRLLQYIRPMIGDVGERSVRDFNSVNASQDILQRALSDTVRHFNIDYLYFT
jgi:hypothetical protein